MRAEKDVLCVRMFGNFSMEWNGRNLLAGAKATVSQFACLMQVLIHAGREGVGREELEQILFDERDVNDLHHAVRSVVYNAKRKLEKAGLPGRECIGQKEEGGYYWTGRVSVREDAALFEELYTKAERETEQEKKLALYQEACRCYTGEFLPSQAGTVWVFREAVRYRRLFGACVEKAACLLREKKEFAEMELLGRYASGIQPLSDWEIVTMEALAGLGQYKKARKLYEDTVDIYFREQGLRPSKKLTETFRKLGMKMEFQHGILNEIKQELAEGENFAWGGVFLFLSCI